VTTPRVTGGAARSDVREEVDGAFVEFHGWLAPIPQLAL
jgi:hypothetical protein